MEQQAMDPEIGMTPVSPETQWGPDAPKGARAVFSRIIKESANVPLFVGQTMINALRDLGYNNTTSALCEHVDNAFQWRGQNVRLYFHEKGKKKDARKIDVLVLDNGVGMSPNVLRAVTAFGGSLCYDNRETVGKYGMGMKAAALSIGPVLEIYSWQEAGAIYRMILDTVDLSNKNTNVVQLPEPVLVDTLPPEVREILVQPMAIPSTKIGLIYLLVLVAQYGVARQAASNYGIRLVTTVLARWAAKTVPAAPAAARKQTRGKVRIDPPKGNQLP